MKRGIFPLMLYFYFFEKVKRNPFAKKNLLIVCSIILLYPLKSDATHIGGADLSYKWVSGDTFDLTLTLYRDCSGISAPNSVSINYKSLSCGYNINVILNKVPGTGTEITKPCTSSSTNCSGGVTPGIQKYEYTGTITLPARCSDWIFGYSICCRNCAITTLSYTPNNCSGVPATYIEATLNNLVTPDNSSPVFTNVPVSFFCIGQEFHYNHGAYDQDGDSLVYSFIDPRSAAAANVVFNPGYSATNPISSSPPMSIDINGDIILNPTSQEVGVMTIFVREYRNGVLIGSVVRDMEVWTSPCSNILPTATGINGSTSFNLVACPDNPISFNINSADIDVAQNVSMSWNYSIPGGVFTSTSGPRPVGTFTWTPALSDVRNQPYTFTVSVQDDNCPLNGFQNYSYNIIVRNFSTVANSTNSNCASPGSGTATVIATGDAPFQYLWSPGGAITSSISGLFPGSYTATVTNAYGCTSQSTANVASTSSLNASLISITNPTCNSSNTGSIAVSAFNGSTPYSYSWSPSGGTAATATGLNAGTYNVIVTDAGGCTYSLSTTLTNPPALSITLTGSALQCNGNASGFASAVSTGGNAPYTYAWSTGATTSFINNLIAGNYSVEVTDANGCSNISSLAITQPPVLTGTVISSTFVSCFGGNDGTGQFSANGGTAPYSYSWFPSGDSLPSASGLTAQKYVVTITDKNNCTATSPLVITQPALLTTSINNSSNVLCSGANNGFAEVTPSGGNGPYTYLWSPNGEVTSSIGGLTIGNYSVKVTDSKGCSSTSSITISQPSTLAINLNSKSDASCFGGTNGSAFVSTLGGSAPFTFDWSPSGGNNFIATNLTQGNYVVTATDVNGCSASLPLTINEPSAITGITSSINTTCFNGTNGSVSVLPSGGMGTYSYLWIPGNYTSATVNGLTAGNYSVTITDTSGCSHNIGVVINQPPELILTSSSITASCGDADGSASVSVSGGTPGYLYFWSPINSNNDTLNDLKAGTYNITVQDSNGCTLAEVVTVSNEGAPSISLASMKSVSCNGGNDGAASVTISGGTGPFKYKWLPTGGTGPSASGLSAGTYTVQVTGKHKCISILAIDIPEPPPLQLNSTSTQVSCFGRNDGNIAVNVSGGSGLYNYSWNNIIGNSPSGTALPPGNYSVTATDQNGCTITSQISVAEPPLLSAIVNNPTPITCNGNNNGSATVSVNGGVLPYSYNWSLAGNNSSTISNLSAGNYSVTVTDASGCSALTGVIINQPAELNVQTSSSPGTCNVSNGTAAVSVSGGVAPFTFIWNQTGDTTSSITGLPQGKYTVTITDSNQCQVTKFIDVTNTGIFSASISDVLNVSCNGGSDGSAVINVLNGTSPYKFDWQPKGGTLQIATGLSAGVYNVLITDANNCTMNVPVTINEPPTLIATVNVSHVKCSGKGNGSATILASGGTGSYTYQWMPGGLNTPVIGSLSGGNYIAIVTDAKNCKTSKLVVVNEPLPLVLTTSTTKPGCSLSNGSASVNVSGGTMPITYLWSPGGMTSSSINGISAGAYTVAVTDSNNCISTSLASVSNTTGPSASLLSNQSAKCFGGNTGHAEIKITGGSSPYTINWHPYGGNSLIADSLSAGSYSVTIQDINNCFTTIPVVISQPTSLKSAITPSSPSCNGGNNGTALAIISGGIAPYTYSWSTGDTTALATGLTKGIFSLIVTDANGCPTSFNTTINEPSPINLNLFFAPVKCFGWKDGFAAVVASGGTPGYSYLWSNGYTYNVGTNFFAGSYTVTVKDAHGCKSDTSVIITEPAKMILTSSALPESCRGLSDGSAAVVVTGGIPPYNYVWWPIGGNSSSATNLPSGGYDIVVTDQNGCLNKINAHVGSPRRTNIATTSTDLKCNGGNDGTARVTVSGGTPPYTYFWSTGSTTSTATNLQAGTYSVVITDNNSCTTEASITINQPPPLIPTIQISSSICNGQSTTIIAQCTGGNPPYTYLWNNGSTNFQQVVSPSTTTNYTVKITDSFGCTSPAAIGTVIVNPAILALASGPDTICAGTFATLLAFGSGGNGGPYNYSWNNGATGSLLTIAPYENTIYSVTVSDTCGSLPMTVSISVVVRPNPFVNFMSDPAFGCLPLEVRFTDLTDLEGIEYYWNFGDGSSDTTRNPSHIYLNPGFYTVSHSVKTEHGCLGNSTIPAAVKVYPIPIAKFTHVPEITTIRNPAVSFFDESSFTEKWEWDFGDNSGTIFSTNTEHTYRDTGTFIVKLITTSDQGCPDTAYGKVIIREEFAVYIPNSFTPNNDGVNDTFISLGMGIQDFELSVYDRWGLKIFNSIDMKKGWDGRIQENGTPCQNDVYLYKINIIDVQGVPHDFVGRVSLVR